MLCKTNMALLGARGQRGMLSLVESSGGGGVEEEWRRAFQGQDITAVPTTLLGEIWLDYLLASFGLPAAPSLPACQVEDMMMVMEGAIAHVCWDKEDCIPGGGLADGSGWISHHLPSIVPVPPQVEVQAAVVLTVNGLRLADWEGVVDLISKSYPGRTVIVLLRPSTLILDHLLGCSYPQMPG